jgi:ribosomal-protein-alanine N-acetyltransferase
MRVFLAVPTATDAAEVCALHRASARMYRGVTRPPRTAREYRLYLRHATAEGSRAWLVRRRGDDAIVGAVELSQIVRGAIRNACLGYHIGAPFARQGYMTEGVQLALARAFGPLKLHRVEANVQPGNRASRALLRRAGFTREGYSRRYLKLDGRWRDHERWAILVEAWRARRRP